ncbi:hypothetical protein BKA67DRAFT_548431 [Truncatella angustata]|uniref:Uncharacterized protein n=1 Tax=Truncatella angustata TaxID=152316 RepID=A0A9P9A3W5_9PEZI|nr:uncharacterized protein BKA67DRAFT_548431 [Truncatella angustata]KAH6660558.1 hypothetical protein BKA67DRAFT_548431 [Truncatella angustata]
MPTPAIVTRPPALLMISILWAPARTGVLVAVAEPPVAVAVPFLDPDPEPDPLPPLPPVVEFFDEPPEALPAPVVEFFDEPDPEPPLLVPEPSDPSEAVEFLLDPEPPLFFPPLPLPVFPSSLPLPSVAVAFSLLPSPFPWSLRGKTSLRWARRAPGG